MISNYHINLTIPPPPHARIRFVFDFFDGVFAGNQSAQTGDARFAAQEIIETEKDGGREIDDVHCD